MSKTEINFAAVVAYTDKIAKDGRMLAGPEGFRCPVNLPFPLPVLWIPPNHRGVSVPMRNVGMIKEAFVVDHRVIVLGHLFREGDGPQLAGLLRGGSRFLEIDVDSGDMTYYLDPLMPELEQIPVGPVIFTKWKLRCAWVGTSPCWDLPPAQFEEIPA